RGRTLYKCNLMRQSGENALGGRYERASVYQLAVPVSFAAAVIAAAGVLFVYSPRRWIRRHDRHDLEVRDPVRSHARVGRVLERRDRRIRERLFGKLTASDGRIGGLAVVAGINQVVGARMIFGLQVAPYTEIQDSQSRGHLEAPGASDGPGVKVLGADQVDHRALQVRIRDHDRRLDETPPQVPTVQFDSLDLAVAHGDAFDLREQQNLASVTLDGVGQSIRDDLSAAFRIVGALHVVE